MFELKEGVNIVLKDSKIHKLNDTYVFIKLNEYETLCVFIKDINLELTEKVNKED